ncbi:hypothetical protein DM02DRAFT_657213 [Periconia macrospinosa]|uniref:Uncharacterized protein n=1 Tax=Periconia macrospinosa TaxID=97972 RepID=A0A2V1DK03_9PLEO|nr:hypothetical protein DM02DRAFT_657213 [Periconia macrospinosa]
MTLHGAGHTQLFIANQLGVTSRQVGYTIRSGSLTPKKRSGRPQKLSQAQCDQIEAFVTGNGPAPSGTTDGGWEEGRYMSYEKLAKGPFASWGVGEYAVRGVLRKRGYVRIGRELVKKASDGSKARKRVRKPKFPITTATVSLDEEDVDDDEDDIDEDDEENDDDGEGDEDDAIMQEQRGSPSAVAAGGAAQRTANNPLLNATSNPAEFSMGVVGNAGMAPMGMGAVAPPAAPVEAPSNANENAHAPVPVAGQQLS